MSCSVFREQRKQETHAYEEAIFKNFIDILHRRIPLLRASVCELGKETHNKQFNNLDDEVFVDILISQQVQFPLDIANHSLDIIGCEEGRPRGTRDRRHNRFGTAASDRMHLVARRRYARGSQGIVGEKSASGGLQDAGKMRGSVVQDKFVELV